MIYNWLKNRRISLHHNQCLLCLNPTRSKYSLCIKCEEDLPKNVGCCLICSIPLTDTAKIRPALICAKCQKKSPYYSISFIPHLYAAPIKQLISQFKFHANLSYAPLLAHAFLNATTRKQDRLPECIIPVPLHKQRLHERGFNQALELARIIAKDLDIPLDYTVCRREKSTSFQSGLNAKQRKKNLNNAFSITKLAHYKHVAIFDDVVTTGSTVNELAKQLKKAGVEVVEVWAIARTGNK